MRGFFLAARIAVVDAGRPYNRPVPDTPSSAAGKPDIERARALSPWFDEQAERHPGWLAAVERVDGPARVELDAAIADHGLDAGLRRFRNREMVRIIGRELGEASTTRATLGNLSALAEHCLDAAVQHHEARLRERHGTPRNEAGEPQSLVVLALGKLGGGELNLSSDVDLVLAFPDSGHCDGAGALANETFFTRLSRAVIRSLSEVTEDGFVFRVDTRLRPFGQSGPLVSSFAAMEQYFQREGRDWERYAWVKARPVAGDIEQGREWLDRLRPFVYRRYIDFSAIEALRDMRRRLEREAQQFERDLKRGPGGIREIEFLVQSFQLLRGGREADLRTPSLFAALDGIDTLGLLPSSVTDELRRDYCWLRDAENRLQAQRDEQTHRVPEGQALQRLATAMHCDGPDALLEALEALRRRVRGRIVEALPDDPGSSDGDTEDWRAIVEHGAAADEWSAFIRQVERRSLSPHAMTRLDALMGTLAPVLDGADAAVRERMLDLVLAVARRSAYLSLLAHHPPVIERLLSLFAASPWVARAVTRHPALLDELIDPVLFADPPTRDDVDALLDNALRSAAEEDARLDALNHCQRAMTLRIAVAELRQRLDGREAQRRLTTLAEGLLEAVLIMARRHVETRHGKLPNPRLLVVGYGSFGARELGYTSDLDLVFLHDGVGGESDGERPVPAERWYATLARRALSLLTMNTPAGRLFEVDTRLRPNGRAGLLVSGIDAFDDYQHASAWTWEWQALCRARPVAGDEALAERFEAIRREVLSQPRDDDAVTEDLAQMRRRMREERDNPDPFKDPPGGMVDIEFVAQLGVLVAAAERPAVLVPRSTPEQLAALAATGWLGEAEAQTLSRVYGQLVDARHQRFLAEDPAPPPALDDAAEICARRLGVPSGE